jgi:hypothetical protein
MDEVKEDGERIAQMLSWAIVDSGAQFSLLHVGQTLGGRIVADRYLSRRVNPGTDHGLNGANDRFVGGAENRIEAVLAVYRQRGIRVAFHPTETTAILAATAFSMAGPGSPRL